MENSSRALNAVLGGSLGVLGGAIAALVFTGSICRGASSDSMCGLILFFLGPIWVRTDAIAGTFAAALASKAQRIPLASWAGAVIGTVFAIAAAALCWIPALTDPLAVQNPKRLRELENWVTYTVPLIVATGGILGGILAKGIVKTRSGTIHRV